MEPITAAFIATASEVTFPVEQTIHERLILLRFDLVLFLFLVSRLAPFAAFLIESLFLQKFDHIRFGQCCFCKHTAVPLG
jgi:hypothetical protein